MVNKQHKKPTKKHSWVEPDEERKSRRTKQAAKAVKAPLGQRAQKAFGYTVWLAVGFILANALVYALVRVLVQSGVQLGSVNEALFSSVAALVIYLLALAIVIGGPWWILRQKTSLKTLGLNRMPSWLDLGLAPLGFAAYMLVGGLVVAVIAELVPSFDVDQAQDVGFTGLQAQWEYALAFITLVILAPFAEEILFRGYLYGKLKKYIPTWVAILVVSILFGAAHGQWNVGINTFVMSIFLCLVRDMSGSLWSSIVLHMIKNGVAYFFLFVFPLKGLIGG